MSSLPTSRRSRCGTSWSTRTSRATTSRLPVPYASCNATARSQAPVLLVARERDFMSSPDNSSGSDPIEPPAVLRHLACCYPSQSTALFVRRVFQRRPSRGPLICDVEMRTRSHRDWFILFVTCRRGQETNARCHGQLCLHRLSRDVGYVSSDVAELVAGEDDCKEADRGIESRVGSDHVVRRLI